MERMNRLDGGKTRILDRVFFAVLLVGYTVITFTLFYRQTLGDPTYYHSDMKAYILEMQGLDSGYSFPYPIFFQLGAFFHLWIESPQLSIAVAVTLLNSLSPVIMKWGMNRLLVKENSLTAEGAGGNIRRLCTGLFITVMVFALLFVSMLYLPGGVALPGIFRTYVGVFSPNPHHNATYSATRPFAIVVFFLFPIILKEYETKANWKHNILFTVFLLLTTMTKPSFTFVMVPAAGLIMLYRLFRAKLCFDFLYDRLLFLCWFVLWFALCLFL